MILPLLAAPSAFKAATVAQGAGIVGMYVAQTAPSVDVLQYGATGVVSISFLYMMYALGAGKIVSRSTELAEAKLVELAEKATLREAEGHKREAELILTNQQLTAMNTRLFDMIDRPT